MKLLNYKDYYEVFRIGVVNKGFTAIAELLFQPMFKDHTLLDETGEPFEVDPTFASKIGNGYIAIHKTIQDEISKKETLEKYIAYFQSDVILLIIDATRDEMLYEMAQLVKNSEISDFGKKQILKHFDKKEYAEFLAKAFQRALLGENHVANPKKKISAADMNLDAEDEFNTVVRKKKPVAVVPKRIHEDEMTYVNQIYLAYSVKLGKKIKSRPDVKKIDYLEHFEEQRKMYYYAETINREIRDSIKKDEENAFGALRDEIKLGIGRAKRKTYSDPVERMDAITERASDVVLSKKTEDDLYGWIGPGEKMGVCHMLVNENELYWVEEKVDAEQSV